MLLVSYCTETTTELIIIYTAISITEIQIIQHQHQFIPYEMIYNEVALATS